MPLPNKALQFSAVATYCHAVRQHLYCYDSVVVVLFFAIGIPTQRNFHGKQCRNFRNIQIWKRFPPVEHECQLWNMSIHVPFRRELSVRFVFTKTPGASVLDCGSEASSPHHLMLHLTSSAQSVMDPQCVRNTICLKAV